MTDVLVSIALCTYNGEKYLKEQLDSLLLQTYSPIEIIIVDDHSTDGTVGLLERYRTENQNIKVLLNQQNIGFNKNFERAISYAKGDFIAICDQDDIWKTNKIERLIANIGTNQAVFSNSELIDSSGNPLGKKLLEGFILQFDYYGILLENFVTGHTMMIHRTLVDKIFPIPEEGFYDWWIGFVAMYHNRLTYIDECLSKYRIHSDSVIQKRLSTKNKNAGKFVASRQLAIFLKYKNLAPKDQELIVKLKSKIDSPIYSLSDSTFAFLAKNFRTYFPKRLQKNVFSRLMFLKKFLVDSTVR